jgi:hypothetical protein
MGDLGRVVLVDQTQLPLGLRARDDFTRPAFGRILRITTVILKAYISQPASKEFCIAAGMISMELWSLRGLRGV